jgi:hypothetical protein
MGLEAMARIGAGAKINSISMIRCEVDLSGSFVGLFGFAMMIQFLGQFDGVGQEQFRHPVAYPPVAYPPVAYPLDT